VGDDRGGDPQGTLRAGAAARGVPGAVGAEIDQAEQGQGLGQGDRGRVVANCRGYNGAVGLEGVRRLSEEGWRLRNSKNEMRMLALDIIF
jgi:hypothetical protein